MTAYTDFHYSPTGSGVISGSQVLEQTEQGINGLGQYVQDNISGAIDTANQALTIAQTADTNATLALNTANSFASAISAANNTANNALTTAQSAQNTANTASSLATTANNNANTALNAANTATANVGTLTNSVNALGNRMTTAENAISTNAGNITTLQTNLQTTNNNVTSAANAASAAQATATSAQNTATLARGQAYVVRYASVAVSDNSTVPYTDLNNTDNVKANDLLLDTNGKLYQISSVDTANETVSVTTPLTQLAVDSGVMHLSGKETASGKKIFSEYITSDGSVAGDEYTLNTRTNLWLMGNRDVENVSGILFDTYRQNAAQGTGIHILGIGIKENSVRYEGCRWGWYWDNNLNGYTFDFKPTTQGANQALKHNLGTSVDKWDTLNGINPGALSLPKGYTEEGADKDYINIASVIQTLDGTIYNYTMPDNGWICVRAEQAQQVQVTIQSWSFGQSISHPTGSTLIVSVPFRKNDLISLKVKAVTLQYARFYPMQGNI